MILGTGAQKSNSNYCTFVAVVFMLLCLSVSSWGACSVYSSRYTNQSVTSCSNYGSGIVNGSMILTCTGFVSKGSGGDCLIGASTNPSRPDWPDFCGSAANCWMSCYQCSTQAEADSVACVLNPSAEGCVEEDVPQNCQEDYAECISWGGVWKKVGSTSAGCQSECSLCGSKALTRVMNSVAASCCGKGKAPPDSISSCDMVASAGVGMTMSRFNPGWNQCGDLSTSDGAPIVENANRFNRFCNEHDMYEEQADTNDVSGGGEGSSSSGLESSASGASFGTELDALGGIYGVLDTIRDTLVYRLTPATEEIRDCLYNFKLCAQLDSLYVDWSAMPKDSTWFYIDTGLVKYLRPFMDASVALDSNQLKAIRKLDTNALKQLRLDSALLENDTATRRSVNNGFDGVLKNDTATRAMVKGVKDGVDSLIDSIGRYLRAVDSSIGSVGAPGTPLGDSLGKLIGILGGDTGSVGSGQYGDSARALGDSIRNWIREGDSKWDSAFDATERDWGVDSIDHLFDSSFSYGTCHGDDCPPCTDSDCLGKITPAILKYGDSIAAQLGDSLIKNVKAQEDSLPTMWNSAMVKLREVSFFTTFDSTFLANIGAKIPNTNTCPEDCFRQDVNGRYAYVAYNMTLDWKLCRPIAPGVLNGLNAFDILKLLARVLTVVTCLFILMWEVSSRRGGGMGL